MSELWVAREKEKSKGEKKEILSPFVAVQSMHLHDSQKHRDESTRRRGDLPVHERLREFANPPFPIGLQSTGFYVCDFARAAVITFTRYSTASFRTALSSRYVASRFFVLFLPRHLYRISFVTILCVFIGAEERNPPFEF